MFRSDAGGGAAGLRCERHFLSFPPRSRQIITCVSACRNDGGTAHSSHHRSVLLLAPSVQCRRDADGSCTGGASGIGLGIVRTLLASTHPSYNVLVVDRSSASFPALLTSLASEVGEERTQQVVECVAADVTRYEELREAFDKARRKRQGWSGRVDVVCAIAGISQVRLSVPARG